MSEEDQSLIVEPVWKIMREYPKFEFDWVQKSSLEKGQSCEDGLLAAHPSFGAIVVVVVCDKKTGDPKYDQPVLVEPPDFGVISVPFITDEQGVDSIRLIKQKRISWLPHDLKLDPDNLGDFPFREFGQLSIETPRGVREEGENYLQAIERETAEEARCKIKCSKRIGETNSNTTYFSRSVPIVAVEIEPAPDKTLAADPTERVLGYRDYSVEEIKELISKNKLGGSLTVTALFHFFLYKELI